MPANKKNESDQNKRPEETRAAEAVTVAWMLSMLATAMAEILTIGSWALALLFVDSHEEFKPLRTLPGLLLFLAVITGIVCLALGPIAQWLRKTRAPTSVFVTAMVIGVLPLINLTLFLMFTPH